MSCCCLSCRMAVDLPLPDGPMITKMEKLSLVKCTCQLYNDRNNRKQIKNATKVRERTSYTLELITNVISCCIFVIILSWLFYSYHTK